LFFGDRLYLFFNLNERKYGKILLINSSFFKASNYYVVHSSSYVCGIGS